MNHCFLHQLEAPSWDYKTVNYPFDVLKLFPIISLVECSCPALLLCKNTL